MAGIVHVEAGPDHSAEQFMVFPHEAVETLEVALPHDEDKVEGPIVLTCHQLG